MDEDSKQLLRARCWERLERSGHARWPGTRGRIPNFVGAEQAATLLAATPEFCAARTIKCNPDTPQRALRYAALRAGKMVYVAVPRLTGSHPFLSLDPQALPPHLLWDASAKLGAARWGVPTAADDLSPVDLIITGSVGVNLEGARLGKGGGYADLEFSLLRRYGKLSETVLVATTVHPSQLCEAGEIEMRTNDVPIDLIATPTSVIRCPRIFGRPSTIDEDLLDPAKRAAMPPIDAALDTPRASEARVPSKIDDDTVTDETEGTS